jgi:hypothetical protein
MLTSFILRHHVECDTFVESEFQIHTTFVYLERQLHSYIYRKTRQVMSQ